MGLFGKKYKIIEPMEQPIEGGAPQIANVEALPQLTPQEVQQVSPVIDTEVLTQKITEIEKKINDIERWSVEITKWLENNVGK